MVSIWLRRHLAVVSGAFLLLLLGSFAAIAVLVVQLQQTREDLDRVESGAALFAAQVRELRAPLTEMGPQLSASLDETIASLERFRTSTLQFPLEVDQQVDVQTELPVEHDVVVPIRTTLPIQQSFETTIQVAGPFGLGVPVDVTVPLDLDVPVDLEVAVPLAATIPVETTVPLQLDMPVSVDVEQTELGEFVDALIEGLRAIQALFAATGD